MDAFSPPWPASMNMNIMEPLAEVDGFEPQTRARSNTWPLPRPDNLQDDGNKLASLPQPAAQPKKNSSRRNAWGNLSYADLITQAITSSQDKRLTLSQIYEWMVQNVPYFKDKGDSNSSAGWKNSIRHNLSLHNRFMRVQNEGTGKSSWWMINPDAKPGKSVRRRAASMETSKFEKRRGRVKKKVEAIRNGLADATPSPSSSVSEGLDLFPDSPIHSLTYGADAPHCGGGFQLSPDFRPRASSNTSSCGRLSPIPAVIGVEPDWSNPSFQPPPTAYTPGNFSPDQLAGNLQQTMKLEPEYMGYLNGQTPTQPPPPYTAPYEAFPSRRDLTAIHATSPYGLNQCPVHRITTCGCILPVKIERMSPTGMSPSYPASEPSPDPQYLMSRTSAPRAPSSSPPPLTPQPQQAMPSTMMGQIMGALNNSNLLDDLNIEGGFDCNVDEVIKHELSMEGSLDFNFSGAQTLAPPQELMANSQPPPPPPSYPASVTTPSWVH